MIKQIICEHTQQMHTIAFPCLRLIALDRCMLHETTDPFRVQRLMMRITTEQLLRNPPIVGSAEGGKMLIVLDGATRVTALRALGIPHVVAQMVQYDDDVITLHTWCHLLSNMTLDTLLMALVNTSLTAYPCYQHEIGAVPGVLAYLSDRGGRSFAISPKDPIVSQTTGLQQLFNTYAGRSSITRVAAHEWKDRLGESNTDIAVIFPIYTKNDLVTVVQTGRVLPAGITRHIIPGRALRVNIPLALLATEQPLVEKQQQLDTWLHSRLMHHGVRYYQEPTFQFDE